MRKKIILIIISILFVIGIISSILIIKHINYTKTYTYKLTKLGYSKADTTILEKQLKKKELDVLLKMKYNKNIIKLVKEKYFIFNNLHDYLKFYKENNDKNISDIIAIINTNTNNKFYTNTKESDISKKELILVNKYNYLTAEYNPDDLKVFSNKYAYGDNQALRKNAYDAFISMWDKAFEDGYTLIVNSSYRSFDEQKKIYDDYYSWYGEEADKKAARAGYSEHQTGLAVDIQSYCSQDKEFDQCEEFTWLSNNAYKYGFILRYPNSKEYLTGYKYESWHFRYVGAPVAKYIHDNNITFDEYYAYYLN